MKVLVFIFFMFMSFSSFAADTGFFGFFGSVEAFFHDIWFFITDVIPRKITEFIFWIKLYLTYMKFYLFLETLRLAHEVALDFIQQMNISEVINVAISNLPNVLQKAAADMRIFDSLSLLVEALITRLVYSVVTS